MRIGRITRVDREGYSPNLRGLGRFIADRYNLSDSEAFKICADVFEFIRAAALDGGVRVSIRRFGRFGRRKTSERNNTPTGAEVPTQWVMTFKRSRNYGSRLVE